MLCPIRDINVLSGQGQKNAIFYNFFMLKIHNLNSQNHYFHFTQNSAAPLKQQDPQLRCMEPLWLAVILTLSRKVSGLECHFVVWLNDK